VTETEDLMSFARPRRPTLGPDIRSISTGELNGRPLDELSALPTSPLYRSKIQPLPCRQCGEDHAPNQTYNHAYLGPETAEPLVVQPPEPVPPALREHIQASTRVAVYVGRHDLYVVAVETSPEWESTQTFKVNDAELVVMIRMVRALGIKVVDKTGGDLASLESEHAS
jgi:hypothetical protein